MSTADEEAALMAESNRPEPRRAPRPDDSRARAEARTAQLLGHGVMEADTSDKFALPDGSIPDGWSYVWKRRTVLGAEDPAYQVALAQTGWEPVPPSRHPELMPEGWTGKAIERDGMVLMERPKEITDMIRKRDERDALRPVRDMEAKLSGGKPNDLGPRKGVLPDGSMVKRGQFEPIPIPE